MNQKREQFLESIKVLTEMKSSLEDSVQYKVIGKEKSVKEKVQDLQTYIEEDIDL